MKIVSIVLLVIALVWGVIALFNFLRQRRAQQRAEREGVVLYADVLSAEPVGGLLKSLNISSLRLRIQEPTKPAREVTLRSRLPPGQKLGKNQRVLIIVDPVNPERVYPASAEAAKKVTLTGTKTEKKLMQAHMKNPRRFPQRPPSNYQPPSHKIR